MGQNNGYSEIVHKLFYWKENNKYIFSRTKFLTIATFIVCFLDCLSSPPTYSAPTPVIVLVLCLIVSIPIFIIGYLIHRFMNIDSSFYEDDLTEDIKHFLFYWHDNTNKFRLSKTKLITMVIIIIGLLAGFRCVIIGEIPGVAMGQNVISLIIAIPVFFIGYAIHQFQSKNNTVQSAPKYDYNNNNELKINTVSETKLHINNLDISPKFSDHLLKVEELKKEFDEKELKVKELITAKFNPPQITYTRFMSVVDNCSKIFNQHYTAVFNIINFGDDSIKVENEINSKINILQSFIDKLDDLSNELVINMSKSNTEDVDNALNDMEDLISTINNYED